MFSTKGKNSTFEGMKVQPVSPRRVANSASAPSIICSDVVMIGTLTTGSDIQIEGRIEGDVRCVNLVIGDAGQVNGHILAECVTIRGRVEGHIRARQVFLCSASSVEGDILVEAFAVEVGAIFEGNCRHSSNPLAEAPNNVAEFHTALEAFAANMG
jgi:cytoskeletal protein CcmA (bactofilin family)